MKLKESNAKEVRTLGNTEYVDDLYMMVSGFSVAEELIDELMLVLVKYNMQMEIDETVWRYAGEDTDTEWLPVGGSRIQRVNFYAYLRWQTNADETTTKAVTSRVKINNS
ncbi:hypothetical protein ACTXT7_006142 [Hymenolepis weldensis]